MANNHSDTEKRLWGAADEFRANSDLKSSEYAVPVLGLIFLRCADHRFMISEKELEGKGSGRRKIGKGEGLGVRVRVAKTPSSSSTPDTRSSRSSATIKSTLDSRP